ncbi:hypothetical protein AA0119_g11475 [Alternaria tenuissima]|uniref:HAT C-terminal dimerisation domain-containing protein n=2 Tax=Alternaria alternata complex TaxID=187734 RepID=A0A4Q4MZB5_ALTAL|nr:hypothetical protein AA0117_g12356 [Alternaria alternata]RYN89287.1 hypothetical protein AA0119_g11475 [Alternaria tenuissima]RYO05932.1 hypothetical protein AA0121_g12239 [Alternaria tenuissima]
MPPRSQKKRSGAPTVAAEAANQATESPSEAAWETQFLEPQPEAEIAAPTEGSHAGTGSIADDAGAGAGRSTWETDGADHFDGIDWERLKQYMKPVKAPTGKKRYCHSHKVFGGGLYDITRATSAAATHLRKAARGHGLSDDFDVKSSIAYGQGQLSLQQAVDGGVELFQEAVNVFGYFNVQQFQLASVLWLVDNNMPMEIISRQSTRDMIKFANPEAESALWRSPRSVATHAMRLFTLLKPQIIVALSTARGFFGIVAHFATTAGVVRVVHDLPISLPQLAGAHTGEAMAAVVIKTLKQFGITPNQFGYFVLDNASNNDTAVAAIARDYGGFDPAHRRLRCGPHTINLIGQALLFGDDKDSYDNVAAELKTEELYTREWRHRSNTSFLEDCQREANKELPADEQVPVLAPIRPVATRWNSYFAAIERATLLHGGFDRYMEKHISPIAINDKRSSKPADAPVWMRSGALSASDWATITEYQNCVEPLKIATKRLDGRSDSSSFGAIYEVLPVFEYILRNMEELAQPYANVDFSAHTEAPLDHLHINLPAAWHKANDYYNKLDDSPIYHAATCFHPYYKYYCENSWRDKPEWLRVANDGFQRLWQGYKLPLPLPLAPQLFTTRTSDIDDVTGAFTRRSVTGTLQGDEYDRWLNQELAWHAVDDGNAVQYWIAMRSKYPCLSQFAIDILTIPASSCECERLFSELGDLLEPKRRAIGSELLAALQLIRAWTRAGYTTIKAVETHSSDGDSGGSSESFTDDSLAREYDIYNWAESPEIVTLEE